MRYVRARLVTSALALSWGLLGAQVAQGQAEAQPPQPAPVSASPDAAPAGGGLFDQAPAEPVALPQSQSISVGTFGLIDLHVKELSISQVLQLLSIQSQRNIIASRNVAGTLSADLYGVDFYEALDALLHTNGFAYREKGNFIYVYTAAELRTMEEAERKLTRRVVRLNYLTATEASTFVSPLLSSVGAIAVSSNVTAGFQPSINDGGANSYAHPDTLLIHDYPENVDQIAAVLAELDVRPKQVLLEATVLKAELREDNAFGVDLTILADFAFTEFTGGAPQAINALINGAVTGTAQAFQTNVGDTGTRFNTRIGIISDDIAAFIKAMDQVVDTTVIAHPKLLVLNRQKADLLIGRRLGYISTTATETATTQTVEFLDVGTQLTVRPFVGDDDFIRMELKPSVSAGEIIAQQGFVIPNQDTQELTTNVMVRNGQTVVLGGLFSEETTTLRKQVPGVGDIPILGWAFRGHDDQVRRSEVIFLVTPTVMRDEALYATGERMTQNVELAQIGARQGLLPWSRSKLTAAHYRNAMQHYQAGNADKALWSANMALRLDPRFIEARKLKEQITGEHVTPVNRSMLKDVIEGVVREQLGAQPQMPASQSAAPAAPAAVEPASIPTAESQLRPVLPVIVSEPDPASVSNLPSPPAEPAPAAAAVVPQPQPAPDPSRTKAPMRPAGTGNSETYNDVLDAIGRWLPPESATAPPDAPSAAASAAVDVQSQP